MKNINKIKNITIFILSWLLVIAISSASMSDNRFRNEARENIKLQEELQIVKEDPITIYTNKVRELNEDILDLEEKVSVLEEKRDRKFCMEVQLNRVVNFEQVDDNYCNDPVNIEELKKL